MKPHEFMASLKSGPLFPLYCFYGEDPYIQELAVRLLGHRSGHGGPDDLNYEVYYGATVSIATIIDSARTLPLLGTGKFVLVKEADRIPKVRHKALHAYCSKPNPKTILIFTAKKLPFTDELVQVVQKQGLIRQLSNPSSAELPLWIQHLADGEGASIEHEAVILLQDLIGASLIELSQAVIKLSLFVGEGQTITRADVEQIISRLRIDSVFELTDYMGSGKRERALVALARLLGSEEPPLRILTMISRHFRLMLQAQALLEQGKSSEQVRESLNMKPFVWKKMLPQLRRFSRPQLELCMQRLWETDRSLKSQQVPPHIMLERLILDLCI